VGEAYVHKDHSHDFIWYAEADGPWVHKPTGKGERLLIINARTKAGGVPGAQLVCKSTRKTGDYHGQMNNGLCTKWLTEKLLPNLPQNARSSMDNAPYHTTVSPHAAPIPMCTKESISVWLRKNGVPVPEDGLNAAMSEILTKMAPAPTDALDEVAAAHGHEIVRTPPTTLSYNLLRHVGR